MFHWLSFIGLLGEIIPGLTHREEQYHEDKKRRHEKEVQARLEHERYKRERTLSDPFWARAESRRKRELLEVKLQDAEWILNYEKRLTKLQKKTAARRSNAEQVGADTDRLRKLEHHLAGLRQNLSLD